VNPYGCPVIWAPRDGKGSTGVTGTGRCEAACGGQGLHLAVAGTAVPGVERAPGPGRVSRVRNMETPLGSVPPAGGAVGRS
jgi:hypothetical protein